MLMTVGDTWYRYIDSDQEWSHDPYELQLRVIRYTPKCVVLDLWGRKRFVLLEHGRKRFAHPTREQAMISYIARKESQIRWTQAQHDRAVENLAAAKAMRDRGFVREPYAVVNGMVSLVQDSSPCPPVVT
jgi:hypothetical protein